MKKILLASAVLLATGSQAFAFDEDAVKAQVKEDMASKIVTADLIAAIKKQNAAHAGLTEAEIIALDKKWRAGDKALIDGILGNDVSKKLKEVKDASQGFYTEIFVMDNKGLNVGQSDTTSDYWQGDEAKWQKTYQVGSGAMFTDGVEFDESSQAFSAQVNATVSDESGAPIGAITFGVSAE